MTWSSYLSESKGPMRSKQESKVVESGSCCSSSRSTNGVIVKRGALKEEPPADDDAKEDTENSVDSEGFDDALEDSTEERFVIDGRKHVESVFSSEEDVWKSSV